ncbi:MAG: type IV pili methyl-accepting chemotaxis transducer N-terminal domain-containing protein [Chloroflexota bacterium]
MGLYLVEAITSKLRTKRLTVKMGGIFLGFALLVLISVGATFWGLNAQKVDAVVINLAGRQRMLTQQMTRLALEIEKQGLAEDKRLLQESRNAFEQTLMALRAGGPAPYLAGSSVELPRTTEQGILEQIDQVEQTWQDFEEQLAVVMRASPDSQELGQAVKSVEGISTTLAAEADQLVRLYEAQSTAKITALRQVQMIFLASALLLLAAGVWVTYRYVLHPLQDLGTAANRIGAGNLDRPVQVSGDVEIQVLGTSMEDMRGRLHTAQQELRAWANTLEERVTQRTQELEALNAVSYEISSRLEIKHVLNSVVEKSRQLLGADAAFLCLLDEQKSSLNLQSTSSPADAVEACNTNADEGWARQVIHSEQAVRCQGFCQVVAPPYRRSHLAAALSIGGRVIGALCVTSQQPDFFSEEAACYLNRLANVASIAMENARLYEQLERSSTLEERHRIAAEMHDGLAQTLSFLTITTDLASEQIKTGDMAQAQRILGRVQHGINQASLDIRRAIASLHDEFPAYYTLQQQLSSLVEELEQDDAIIEWRSQTNMPLILAHSDSEQVLRVVREALLNAKKYSQASKISIRLERSDGTVIICIEDNGVGFDPQEMPGDERPHFGLKIMQARAARLGGKLEVHSAQGQGTQIVLTWSIEKVQKYA